MDALQRWAGLDAHQRVLRHVADPVRHIEAQLKEWRVAFVKAVALYTDVLEHKRPRTTGGWVVTALQCLPHDHHLVFPKQPKQPVHAPRLRLHVSKGT
jgi:hypothetical protein